MLARSDARNRARQRRPAPVRDGGAGRRRRPQGEVRPDPRGRARPVRGRPQALPDLLARAAGAPATARLHRRDGRRGLRSVRARHPRRHSHHRQGRAAGERLLVRDRHLRTVARGPGRRRRLRRRRRSHRSRVGRGPPRGNEAPTVARLPALDCARPPRPRRLLGRGGGVRRHVLPLPQLRLQAGVPAADDSPAPALGAARGARRVGVARGTVDDRLADRPVRAPRRRGRADRAPRRPGRRSDRNRSRAGNGGRAQPAT